MIALNQDLFFQDSPGLILHKPGFTGSSLRSSASQDAVDDAFHQKNFQVCNFSIISIYLGIAKI